MTNDRNVLAYVPVDGEFGRLKVVKDRINNGLDSRKFKGVRAAIDSSHKRIIIYSIGKNPDIPNEDQLKSIIDGTGHSEHITNLEYDPERLYKKPDVNPTLSSTSEEYKRLEVETATLRLRVKGLEEQVGELETGLDTTTRTRDSYERDLFTTMEENEKLESRLGQLSSRNTILEGRVVRMEKDSESLKKASESNTSLHDSIIKYLSDFTSRLTEFEGEAGEEISSFSEKRAIDSETREMIEQCYADSPETTDDNIRRFYDGNNGEKFDKYNQTRAQVEATRIQIDEGKIPVLVVDAVLSALEPFEKEIAAYEQSRERFVSYHSERMRDYSNTIERQRRIAKLAQEKKCSKIPVYLHLEERTDGYVLSTFLPTRNGNSNICDRVVSENILSEGTIELMDDDTVQGIKKDSHKESGITYYEITLPKNCYDERMVNSIKTSIEENLRTGFGRSGLDSFGLEVELTFNRTVTEGFTPNESRDGNLEILALEVIRNNATREGEQLVIKASDFTKIFRGLYPDVSRGILYRLTRKLREDGHFTYQGHATGTVYCLSEQIKNDS